MFQPQKMTGFQPQKNAKITQKIAKDLFLCFIL